MAIAIARLGDFQRARILEIQKSQLKTQAIQAQPSKPSSDQIDDDAAVFIKSSSSGSPELTPNYTRPTPKAAAQSNQTDKPQSTDAQAILNATIAGATVVQKPLDAEAQQTPEVQVQTDTPKEAPPVEQPEENAAPAINQDAQGESESRSLGANFGAELSVTA